MFETTRLSLFSRKNLLARTVAHNIPEITKYRDISGCSIYPTTFMRSEWDRKHNKDYKDNGVFREQIMRVFFTSCVGRILRCFLWELSR